MRSSGTVSAASPPWPVPSCESRAATTSRWPETCPELGELRRLVDRPVVLDGEIVALDGTGPGLRPAAGAHAPSQPRAGPARMSVHGGTDQAPAGPPRSREKITCPVSGSVANCWWWPRTLV
jgi:hypothetical protein